MATATAGQNNACVGKFIGRHAGLLQDRSQCAFRLTNSATVGSAECWASCFSPTYSTTLYGLSAVHILLSQSRQSQEPYRKRVCSHMPPGSRLEAAFQAELQSARTEAGCLSHTIVNAYPNLAGLSRHLANWESSPFNFSDTATVIED